MFDVFECVALAVREKGLSGLNEFVPGASYIIGVAGRAYKLWSERRKAAALRAEIAQVAVASAEEARRVAEEVARAVVKEGSEEDRRTLALYLAQLPGAVRQSLKRAADPTGRTVPPDFAADGAAAFLRILPPRAPHFRPGAELPGRAGWRLTELLGTGGFGEVWLARHAILPHPRAVKFCTDAAARARLTAHEGRVVARVMAEGSHPNVVPLLDALLDGETPWLMYEYVGGGTLTDLVLRWQALPDGVREPLTVGALAQLAGAVGAFHRLAPAVVHRDLKPANVLVEATGAEAALRITDFGIGGVVSAGAFDTSLRGAHTPLYASPQQVRGEAPDPRDDVYALGVIAYQMLTGRLESAPGARFERELRARGASPALVDLIGDCVDADPANRPADARELAARLGKNLSPPPPPLRREGEPDALAGARGLGASQGAAPAAPPLAPPPFLGEGVGGRGSSPLTDAPATFLLPALAAEPEPWRVPLRGAWFARPVGADVPWAATGARLPGEVIVKPGEAYRLAVQPDSTDVELANLRALAGLPGLEAIDLSGCVYVTDAGLMHLAELRGLKAVALAGTQATDAGVSLLLTRFPDIEAVSLAGAAGVSDAVVPHLLRLRKLTALALPPRADTADVRAEFARRRPACQLM